MAEPSGRTIRISESSREELQGIVRKQAAQVKEQTKRLQQLKDENDKLRAAAKSGVVAALSKEQEALEEKERRLETLQMQVDLYKEKEKELTSALEDLRKAKEEEAAIMNATIASLNDKASSDDSELRALRSQVAALEKELQETQLARDDIASKVEEVANLQEQLAAVTEGSQDPVALSGALREREIRIVQLQGMVEDRDLRIQNLTRSHEAFIQQNREEMAEEIARHVEEKTAHFEAEQRELEQQRRELEETFATTKEDMQRQIDELRGGLESSQVWQMKVQETVRLRSELAKVSEDLAAQIAAVKEMAQMRLTLEDKNKLIASLRDQVDELEGEMHEIKELCSMAIKQAKARSVAGGGDDALSDSFNNTTLSVPIATRSSRSNLSSAASSGSTTPPSSPKDGGRDLFDIAVSGKTKSKKVVELERQLRHLRDRVRQEEEARKRSMDEVENNRADFINSLLREQEELKRELERARQAQTQQVDPSNDMTVVRLRGEFQRERETWELHRLELEATKAELEEKLRGLMGEGGTPVDMAEYNKMRLRCAEAEEGLLKAREAAAESSKQLEEQQARAELLELEKESMRMDAATSSLAEENAQLKAERDEQNVRLREVGTKMELLTEQVRASEQRRQELNIQFKDLQGQLGVATRNASRLREAESKIEALTAENLRLKSALERKDKSSGALALPSRGVGSIPDFLQSPAARPEEGTKPATPLATTPGDGNGGGEAFPEKPTVGNELAMTGVCVPTVPDRSESQGAPAGLRDTQAAPHPSVTPTATGISPSPVEHDTASLTGTSPSEAFPTPSLAPPPPESTNEDPRKLAAQLEASRRARLQEMRAKFRSIGK